MMHLHRMICLACVCLWPTMALAQPLADRVPADALIYYGWAGRSELGAAYDQSHLKAVIEKSQLARLMNESIPQLIDRIAADEPEAREPLTLLHELLGAAWQYPTALYVGEVDWSGPQPMPRAAVICRMGDQAPAMAGRLNAMIAAADDPDNPFRVRAIGGVLLVSLGDADQTLPDLVQLLEGEGGLALSNDADFRAAARQMHESPALAVYADVQALLNEVDQMVEHEGDPEGREMWPKLRSALGLDGLRCAVGSGGFDGPMWSERAFIDAPAPRTGLFSLLDGESEKDDLTRIVPESASWAGAGSLDLAAIVEQIRLSLGEVDPEAQMQFDQSMEQAAAMFGIHPQRDLLEAIGPDWAYYSDESVAGRGLAGLVLVNQLRDAEKAEQALTLLEQIGNMIIAQQMAGEEIQIQFRHEQVDGLTLHYLAVPIVAPTWAVDKGRLYISLYPQSVVGAIARAEAGGRSIVENAALDEIRQRVGAPEGAAFWFADLPQTAGEGYQVVLTLTRLYMGFGDMFGIRTPPLLVPPLADLKPHIHPSATFAWTDEAGMHIRASSPFPGSEMLAADQDQFIGQQAMMLGIMVPARGRAREVAERAVGGANLRGIGEACLMYANEHDGQFPEDLSVLIIDGRIAPKTLLNPRVDGHLPLHVKQMPLEDQAEWVVEQEHYVYLGGSNEMSPDDIIAYENPEYVFEGEGITILFGDTHVEFVSMGRAMHLISQAEGGQ